MANVSCVILIKEPMKKGVPKVLIIAGKIVILGLVEELKARRPFLLWKKI